MTREPYPPAANRGDALGQLKRERWLAQDAGEVERVQQLDRQIEELSAGGTATAPTRETAASTPPHATTARTNTKPGPKPGRKPTTTRSSHGSAR